MKKLNVKSLGEKLVPIAAMSVGFAAAKAVPFLVGKVYKPKDGSGMTNTLIGVSEIAAGLFLSTMKNKHLANIGTGIAISGVHTFLADPVNKGLEAAGLKGINGIGYSYGYKPNYSGVACPPQAVKSLN